MSRLSRHSDPERAAFTLIEVLVVAALIGLLASMALVGMSSVQATAKEERTRAQITRIDELIGRLWDQYRYRRVPYIYNGNLGWNANEINRLNVLREMMRMELPDRRSDVLDPPVVIRHPISGAPFRPARSQAYLRRAMLLTGSSSTTELASKWTTENQGSECLYLILSNIRDTEGGHGLSFLREAEIVDLDGDGIPSIVDGWDQPIRLLRWPAGFQSPRQTRNPAESPDPFDPRRVFGQDKFLLYPLIMSGGPDETFDLKFDGASPVHYSTTSPPNDPYSTFGGTGQLGAPFDANGNGVQEHMDNIHNHLLETAQ